MLRHKFFWQTLFVLGLLTFSSGCSSSSDDSTPATATTPIEISDENPSDDSTSQPIPTAQEVCEQDSTTVWNSESNTCIAKEIEKDTTEPDETVTKSLSVSGIAIDGYISGGTVSLNDKTVQTDSTGNWNITLSDLDENATLPINRVTVSGGTDIATGKGFEGTLSNIVKSSDWTTEGTNKIIITPLTTLAVLMSNDYNNIENSKELVAKSLGLVQSILDFDPIAVIENETTSQSDKENSAEAIKQALLIQKLAESLAKSLANADTKFSDVFEAVLSTISAKMKTGEVIDFNSLLVDDAFSQTIALKLVEDKTVETKRVLNKVNASVRMKRFAQMLVKLRSATKITSKAVKMISKINSKTLTRKTAKGASQLNILAKATEIITSNLEKQLEKISKIEIEVSDDIVNALVKAEEDNTEITVSKDDVKSDALDKAEADAEKVANAVIMMGGIDSIAEQVEIVADKVKDAETNSDENSTVEASFDIDSFDSLLSDDIIEKNSAIYDSFEELGISSDAILDATQNKDSNKSILDIAVENQNIIAEKDGSESIDTAKVDNAKASIKDKLEEAKKLFDESTDTIKIVTKVVPICKNNEKLNTDTNICEAIKVIPTCKDNEKLNVEKNICEAIIPTCKDSETLNTATNICEAKNIPVEVTCSSGYYKSNNQCFLISTPVDVDKLTLKSNKVTFGKDNFAKTIKTKSGVFSTVKYQPLVSISDEDKIKLLSLSFDLENFNFENGDSKNVILGIKVENQANSETIMAIVPNITLNYNNSNFGFDISSSTILHGYGVTQSGESLSAELSQTLDLTKYLTIASNKFTFDYFELIQKIEKKVSKTSNLINSYFTKDGGEYKISFFISGVDGFNGMKTMTTGEISSSFSGDNRNNVLNKFSSTTFGIDGLIKITAIGNIPDINNTTSVNVNKYFSDAYAKTFSIECQEHSNEIKISNDGIITINASSIFSTECNVSFTDDENTEISRNFVVETNITNSASNN